MAAAERAPAVRAEALAKTYGEVRALDGLNVEIVSGLEAGQKLVERPPKEITAM